MNADPARPLFPRPIPFIESLGLQAVEFGDGGAVLTLDLEPRHCNSWQMAHGGVVMTMLDVAMAMASRSLDADHSAGSITIEMKTTFIAPARGPRLTVRGVCLHRTVSLAFCEAELRDQAGRMCARASGTFKPHRTKNGV